MRRHARRPSFGPTEQQALLAALGHVRHQANLCGSAMGYNSPRYSKCHALAQAIDALAEDLTGDREYFWTKGHGISALPTQGDRKDP